MNELFFAEPTPLPPDLWELARSYYDRCEAYDRTVCTGPIGRDGIMPANYRELGLINQNANNVLREVRQQAESLGFTREQLKAAMRKMLRE